MSSNVGSVQTWLQGHPQSVRHDQAEEQPVLTESEHQSGFITSLYSLCAQQIVELKKSLRLGRKDLRTLKHVQAKFYLFGDSFEHGKLESCLSADDELHQSVLSLLAEIGRILSESKPCRRCYLVSWFRTNFQ